jgi:organic radical activating enzyme
VASEHALKSTTELVLQPFGVFASDMQLKRFDVFNSVAGGLLVALRRPTTREDFLGWAAERRQEPDIVERFWDEMCARGYLVHSGHDDQPCQISFAEPRDRRILKAVRGDFEITNRCNLRCSYCYAEANTSKSELSTEQWVDILDGMHRHGLRAALFSGGEPFLHRGFMEILQWSATRFVIEINTNGTQITPAVAEDLSRIPIKVVQVSLDSLTEHYHDSVRGRGSHAKALSGIRNLVNSGVSVQISTVITQSNRAELPELAQLADQLGVAFKADSIVKTGYALEIPAAVWGSAFEVRDRPRVASSSMAEQSGFEPLCQSQMGYVAVSHQGVLKPCNMRERFFDATDGILIHAGAEGWWNSFYGETRLAQLATAASQRSSAGVAEIGLGHRCRLQDMVAAGVAPRD